MARVAEALTFALPKGRILKQAMPILAAAGIDLSGAFAAGDRRLRVDLPGGHKALLVKPTDVPTYVEHGIADFGIAGRDTLEEQCRDLYEPVDLGIGLCRMVVAQPKNRPARLRRGMTLRVATKYPRVSARYYRQKGIQPEIIPLYGSIELAPLTGLADQIVDLVESGETLRQNRLVEVETVFEVSSRLVVHPASLKLKQAAVTAVVEAVSAAVSTKTRRRTATR
jgi:ATP phosphoribosyltransferase